MENKQLEEEFYHAIGSWIKHADDEPYTAETAKDCSAITLEFFLENTRNIRTFDELLLKIEEIQHEKRKLETNT